jgi:hypothetical protein
MNYLKYVAGAIEKLVVDVLNNYYNDVVVNAQEDVRDALRGVATNVRNNLGDIAHVMEKEQCNIPVLPDNVKWISTFGNSQIVVIEYKPCVRNLWFARFMLNGCPARDHVTDEQRKDVISVPVALPYVILTMFFSEGSFCGLSVNYRTRPLCVLSDMLYHSNMLNVTTGQSKVCMGNALCDVKLGSNHLIFLIWF